jgi:RNA-directed DNA polymerase
MEVMVVKLNRIMRGWGNYHRHVVASETFVRIDNYFYHQLWRMLHRRHPTKSKKWLVNKYWSMPGHKWVFAVWSVLLATSSQERIMDTSSLERL